MNQKQRNRLSEKIADLGNLAGAATIFGQLVSGKPLNLRAAFVFVMVSLICY